MSGKLIGRVAVPLLTIFFSYVSLLLYLNFLDTGSVRSLADQIAAEVYIPWSSDLRTAWLAWPWGADFAVLRTTVIGICLWTYAGGLMMIASIRTNHIRVGTARWIVCCMAFLFVLIVALVRPSIYSNISIGPIESCMDALFLSIVLRLGIWWLVAGTSGPVKM